MTTPSTSTPSAQASSGDPVGDIYRALKRGVGREHVNDSNVDALIQMAQQQGDAQLEYLLWEWRSPCGDDPDAPDLTQLRRNSGPG